MKLYIIIIGIYIKYVLFEAKQEVDVSLNIENDIIYMSTFDELWYNFDIKGFISTNDNCIK